MGIACTRIENDSEIVIIFKYNALRLWVILALVVFLVTPGLEPFLGYVVFGYFVYFFLYIVATWSANREVKKAMASGSVAVSGKVFSFSNPITYKIKK